jgi:gamma-glutamylcyclotransferase (GGCT)/AIG2-like uncharacterized protein YtfP
MASDFLFVYGTLMHSVNNPMAQLLRANSSHVGPAQMQGKLYRISWYPGVIDSAAGCDIVRGDLFKLHGDIQNVMVKLDAYEGIGDDFKKPYEYSREVRDVSHNGKVQAAMVYIYRWDISASEHLPDGQFTED